MNSGCIFSEQVVVFIFNNRSDFSVLQSNLHAVFAWQYSSKMKNDLRYGPTDAFEPFAFPNLEVSEEEQLTEFGESYHESRRNWMLAEDQGLTKLYRHYHDTADNDHRIANLRDLHREIDLTVARAYGWDDLDLGHGFHEVPYLPENDRVRFTISEPARVEVLRRLALLNKERYEEEVAQGLHSKKGTSKKKTANKKKRKQTKVYEIPSYSERNILKAAEPPSPQMDIFSSSSGSQPSEQKGNQWGSEPIDQILAWLEAHPGWHSKQVILNGCQADVAIWDKVIQELLDEGFLDVKDKDAVSQYRAKDT